MPGQANPARYGYLFNATAVYRGVGDLDHGHVETLP